MMPIAAQTETDAGMHSVAPVLARGYRYLFGTESGRLDAELLLAQVLSCTRADLIGRSRERVSAADVAAFHKLLRARRDGAPVAYLLQQREFWSIALQVTQDTLIPRPETELLVELALALDRADDAVRVADLGTGSGAIAVAIAAGRPRWFVIATDISEPALEVAQGNVDRLGLRTIAFVCGNWFAPLRGESFDLVLCNPPYVASTDPHLLQGDLRFEPRLALDGGGDGLRSLRRVIVAARSSIRPGGWLMLEHGATQGKAVRDLLRVQGYERVRTHCDLAGLERVSVGRCEEHG